MALDPTFTRVLEALATPAAYPHPAPSVTRLQTHLSVVFLAGEMAYKLKKPLRLDFVDLSTLDRRRELCHEEVRLNRRLSPNLYRGVLPITESKAGICVGGVGSPIEWAIQMRRLPDARMMDRLLCAGTLSLEQVRQLAELIAAFHAQADTGPAISAFGTSDALRSLWDEHFTQTRRAIGRTLSSFQDGLLNATAGAWLARKETLLHRRVMERRIRDGHGDLRTSAVCFTEPIQVFDCLEFSQRFRCADVASEVAFLVMDLTLNGRPDLGEAFVRRYVECSGDPEVPSLLAFHACYRACVRGKVEGLRAEEPEVPPDEQARAASLARNCFALACQYARADAPPLLLLVTGLSGTGKSTLAETLGTRIGADVVVSDVVRKELHGFRPTEHARGSAGEAVYSEDATRSTYAELMERARPRLAAGRSVVLDATFQRSWQRTLARALADREGALLVQLELRASDETVKRRLAGRARSAGAVSDADWAVYLAQKEAWEPVTGGAWEHLVVSAEGPPGAGEQAAVEGLHARLEPTELFSVGP
jgi:uncharacterized protein